jgi:hypothetical protein
LYFAEIWYASSTITFHPIAHSKINWILNFHQNKYPCL